MNAPSARRGSLQIVVDVALALGLVAALAVVFALDRRSPSSEAPAEGGQLQVVEEPQTEPAPVRRLRLGVTPEEPVFDDMGRLLDSLGEGYRYQKFPMEDLLDKNKIAEFDVIFLTCSGVPVSWLGRHIGQGDRPDTEVYEADEKALAPVYESLRQFVGRGGTLYASDLHYKLVSRAFVDYARPGQAQTGSADQNVNAEVVDPGLRELIGGEMPLKFDMEGWYPAAFAGEKLTTYLRGSYKTQQGRTQEAAFLVKFPYRDGTVIFTSFHNEKQNSETELKLLRYLVFSAVTAEVESRVQRTMVRGGFSPAKQNLFSASAGAASATTVYHADQAGHLQFALGFQNLGARLKLTVKGPGGKTLEQEGDSTFTIDVPDAEAGDWQYTVTAIKLPNENFPFTVTVGRK
ncbi:MAG TPA: hypothetical protein VMV10_16760 [Pirellulales bacterium]|nr:hypothetical protein [Pirellulales bacterium]